MGRGAEAVSIRGECEPAGGERMSYWVIISPGGLRLEPAVIALLAGSEEFFRNAGGKRYQFVHDLLYSPLK